MDMRRVGCVLVLLILHFTFAMGRAKVSRKLEEFYPYPPDVSPEIDDKMVEQLWTNCRLDLMKIKEIVKIVDLHFLEEMSLASKETNSIGWSVAKLNLEKAISVLPLQMKQTLFHCLEAHNIPLPVSLEEGVFKNWYSKYFGSLFELRDASRRYLGVDKLLQDLSPTPSPSPAPPPSVDKLLRGLSPTPSPSPAPPPTSSNNPNPKPSAKAPKKPIFPSNLDSKDHPPGGATPRVPSHLPSKKHDNQKQVSIIAGVAAAGSFLFAAVLIFCFLKCRNRTDSGNVQNDDKPLLTLKSHFPGVNKDFQSQPIQNGTASSGIQNSSSSGAPSSGAADSSAVASNTSAPLPPPPGRVCPPPPGPPPPPPPSRGSRPPPPPKGSLLPPRAQPISIKPKVATRTAENSHTASGEGFDAQGEDEAPKTKLKPFFWDKLLANPDHSMVWHQIKSGSFQCDEEMIENLFGYTAPDKNKTDNKKEWSPQDPSTQYIKIIDPKKAQNLSILLRALNLTTEEVRDALLEGNELPSELLQTLVKMAPTVDEELKLRLYSGELSLLGPAERFLKVLVDIPFAFKRMDSLHFMNSVQEEMSSIKESLATLEVACKEVKSNRLFLKLLEAVLKTGNRMNDGTLRGCAQAFKLDTLLKLADVKGADGKTTLLHFVVQEIIRSEGLRAARAARESRSPSICSVKSEDLVEDSPHETEDDYRSLGLQVVSGLSGELENVRKASVVDADSLRSTMSKLGQSLVKSREFLNTEMKDLEEDSGFHRTLKSFVERAESDITRILEEEKRIADLVRSTGDYFHGNAGKDEALRLFVIVRDFLIILDKVCNEVRQSMKPTTMQRNRDSPKAPPSTDLHQPPSPDIRQRLFPAITDRRVDDSSSDDESSSP